MNAASLHVVYRKLKIITRQNSNNGKFDDQLLGSVQANILCEWRKLYRRNYLEKGVSINLEIMYDSISYVFLYLALMAVLYFFGASDLIVITFSIIGLVISSLLG